MTSNGAAELRPAWSLVAVPSTTPARYHVLAIMMRAAIKDLVIPLAVPMPIT